MGRWNRWHLLRCLSDSSDGDLLARFLPSGNRGLEGTGDDLLIGPIDGVAGGDAGELCEIAGRLDIGLYAEMQHGCFLPIEGRHAMMSSPLRTGRGPLPDA